MQKLKEFFRNADEFLDNDYLEEYCLLLANVDSLAQEEATGQNHHAIPVSYFKNKYNCKSRRSALYYANAEPNKLIYLTHSQHVLAHYYLCLCTKGSLYNSMVFAFCNMLNVPVSYFIENKDNIDELFKKLQPEVINKLHDDHLMLKQRPVRCVETGQTFQSVKEATKWCGCQVSCVLKTGILAAGYHWAYLDDYTFIIKAPARVPLSAGGSGNVFTENEIDILKKRYAIEGTDIPELLEYHSRLGIISKANKLGLKHTGRYVAQAIRCIETGEVFESIKQAGIWCNKKPSSFYNVVPNPSKTVGGYHWEYVS